jgi:ATP/maltotriose-dependent transcriptional regulator MalT
VIEYALAHGLSVVHWDCEAFNIGSIRTAEKLGLQLVHRHTMHTMILNPVLHEVNRAWSKVDAGDYAAAATICQGHIDAAPESAHVHFYYVLARCRYALSDLAGALDNLEHAAELGWDDLGEVVADFPALASDARWPGIIGKVAANAVESEG